MVRTAKREYYTTRINESHNCSKQMWKILNHLLPSKRQDSEQHNSALSADIFNKYFSSIGENLTKHLGDVVFPDHTIEKANHFEFLEINSNQVLHYLLKLSNSTSLDIIDMDNKLLRMASPIIAPLLCHVFNLSLNQGIVPSDWKLAKVTPIYKGKGSHSEPGNYRPISVVPTVAKLMEKLVKAQLTSFFDSNNLFSETQFAYMKTRSTSTALHCLLDKFLDNINSNKINGVCQIDLSKGFDTINVDILLYKLRNYGFLEDSLPWFSSYFTEHKQQVFYDNVISSKRIVNLGLPQGTVLGPIFYLLYTNDLPNYLSKGQLISYADDTNLIASGNDETEVLHNLNISLTEATKWFKSNRLIINASKSCTMLVGSKYRIDNLQNTPILNINNVPLPMVSEAKFLGVIIDNTLCWKAHVSYLCSKINPKIGLLHGLRHYLDESTLNTLYATLIQPHFDYCLTVWGKCPKKYLLMLQKLQNRASRAFTGNFSHDTSPKTLIKNLNWMSIETRYIYFLGILIFKCLNNMAPPYLSSLFDFYDKRRFYQTRAVTNNDLIVPCAYLSIYKSSVAFNGPTLWNSLPSHIKEADSLYNFKNSYKNISKG